MTAVRYEAHLRNRFCMVFVSVDKLLRNKVLRFVVASEFDIQVCSVSARVLVST
jgi:hypothetical protein